MLGPTLDALQGGKALGGFDLLEMSEAIAQTFAHLVAAIGPVAFSQAERAVETSRLAVLRHKASVAEHERAVDLRDWVAQQGSMAALRERLEQAASGHVTIRHESGAPALDRLRAVADGIGRELDQQRNVTSPLRVIADKAIER